MCVRESEKEEKRKREKPMDSGRTECMREGIELKGEGGRERERQRVLKGIFTGKTKDRMGAHDVCVVACLGAHGLTPPAVGQETEA